MTRRARRPAPGREPASGFRLEAIVIFLAALAVRLAHLWSIRDAPFFQTLMGDSRGYDRWAQQIAAGDWLGAEVFYQAPLYPYALGVIYAALGRSLMAVRICQAILGSAACAALGYAGWRLVSRRAGIAAGLMLACYAPAVFFDGLIQKSTLDVFFVCAIVALLARLIAGGGTRTHWLLLGAAAGGLALTRENAFAIVAVLLVWAATRRAADAAAVLLGLAMALAPVALRNSAVGGGLYLTTSQFGPNFYIGNHAGSDGTYAPLRAGRGAPEYERADAREIAERAAGRTLTPREVSGYWTDRTLDDIRAHPLDWLRLLGRKTALLWNRAEMLDTESQSMHERRSPLLRVLAPAGHFGVLVPLALLGLGATWPHRRRLWVLYAMLAAYAGSVVLFYVFARYRFPLVPFLVLFAAAGLAHAGSLRAHSRAARAGWVAAAAAAAVFCNRPLLSDDLMQAISATNLGAALHEDGRFEEAAASYREAIAIRPGHAPAHNNLGAALRALGRHDEAIAQYEEALRLHPGYPAAQRNLARALHARGGGRAARGAVDEAIADLRRAIVVAPDEGVLRHDLGSLLLEGGRYAEAADELRAALAGAPTPETHNNLGIALASQGRLDEAATQFEAALALRPGFADARKNLATARSGRARTKP